MGSLSARRAWIEIFTGSYHPHFHVVALRKESVDRNVKIMNALSGLNVALRKESVDRNALGGLGGAAPQGSLSARRAWIEIYQLWQFWPGLLVALRKESVDRNRSSIKCAICRISRSPQGERG